MLCMISSASFNAAAYKISFIQFKFRGQMRCQLVTQRRRERVVEASRGSENSKLKISNINLLCKRLKSRIRYCQLLCAVCRQELNLNATIQNFHFEFSSFSFKCSTQFNTWKKMQCESSRTETRSVKLKFFHNILSFLIFNLCFVPLF